MKKSVLSIVTLLFATWGTTLVVSNANAQSWTLKGSWTDACCCRVACPCFFGSKATEGFCEGVSLLEIDSGQYGDVELNGLAVLTTHKIGKWAKIYVSDKATKEQVDALGSLVPKALPFLDKGSITKVEAVPLEIQREKELIRFSVPETTVELAPVMGANGKLISLQNLPAKGTPFPPIFDHVQYKSKTLVHKSANEEFSWSGRNGFVAKVDLASVQE